MRLSGAHTPDCPTQFQAKLKTKKLENRKSHLLKSSQQIIDKFDFQPKQPIEADDLKSKLSGSQKLVQDVVADVYEAVQPGLGIKISQIPEIRLAYLLNIQKMIEYERTRKDGLPYYIHPQSVSQRFLEHAPADMRLATEGIIGALLHDYLEEGDGVNTNSLEKLKEYFPKLEEDYLEQLILLTEPNFIENGKKQRPELEYTIDYDLLKKQTGYGRKALETAIFGLMLRTSRVMQLVVPVDKLDNVGDCDAVQRKKTSKEIPDTGSHEYKKKLLDNLAKTLGTFSFYASNCALPDSRYSRAALEEAVGKKVDELSGEFPELAGRVLEKSQEFGNLCNDKNIKNILLDQMIPYFKGLGLAQVVARLEKQRTEQPDDILETNKGR